MDWLMAKHLGRMPSPRSDQTRDTKAFDLISRTGLFKLLEKTGCPPKLLSIIASFHVSRHGTVSFDGEIAETFTIDSGVKQGCVLAPTLFGIFLSLMLTYALASSCTPDIMANYSTRNGYKQTTKVNCSS